MPWRLADVCPEDDVQCLVGRGCKSGAPPVEAARQWSKRPRGNECDNNCHLVVKCRKCCLDVILPAEAAERTLNPFVGIHSSSWTWSVHPSIFLWASSAAAAAQMAILTSNAFHANRSWQNLSPFFSSSFAEFGEIDMRAWRQLWAMSSACYNMRVFGVERVGIYVL